MTAADAIARLREIAAARRRLDDEEEQLLIALEGDDCVSPPQAPAPDMVATDILTAQHITVAQLADKLRTSEKTTRGIGNAAGARVQIGGRVLFDLAVVRQHVATANYRKLPCSSLSAGEEMTDDVIDDERERQ